MKINLDIKNIRNGTEQAIADHIHDYIDMILEFVDDIDCCCDECMFKEDEYEEDDLE